LHFDAVSGRNNAITVTASLSTQGYVLVLTDPRNAVTPGSGCTRVNDNTVRCGEPGAIDGQDIQLGDGDDTYTSSVSLIGDTVVHCGTGNDTVNGDRQGVC
jgi:hypothetical protein